MAAQILVVMALHDPEDGRCPECGVSAPCPTRQAMFLARDHAWLGLSAEDAADTACDDLDDFEDYLQAEGSGDTQKDAQHFLISRRSAANG
jgi:hypothetical protein